MQVIILLKMVSECVLFGFCRKQKSMCKKKININNCKYVFTAELEEAVFNTSVAPD